MMFIADLHMEAVIGGLVGTAITALGVKLVDWIKADSKLLTLSDVVQQSDESMKALDSWAKTYKALAELPDSEFKTKGEQAALLAVTRLKDRLENADAERTVTVAVSRLRTFLGSSSSRLGTFLWLSLSRLRAFLRLSSPTRWYVWIPQLCFYFFAFVTAIFLAMPRRDPLMIIVFALIAVGCWTLCHLIEIFTRPKQSSSLNTVAVPQKGETSS